RDHRLLRRYTYASGLAALVLLLLPLVPLLGRTVNGARIWIFIGPMSFQPGELAKILLAIFFAGYLVAYRDPMVLAGPKILGIRFARLRDVAPLLGARVASLGCLVLQPGPTILGIRFPRLRDMGPILVAWVASVGILVFQRALGTSLLYFGLFVAMLYVATAKKTWIFLGLGMFAGGAIVAAQLFSHVQQRVDGW